MYGLSGTLVATEGNGDRLEAHLREAATALGDVGDCLLYLVNRLPSDPEAVWVVEVWTSAEAHAASLELPAVQRLIAEARPIIAGMRDRQEFTPAGGKGL